MMKTRLIFVGGFLGAGKTSLLLQSMTLLKEQGYRVALIPNDQGRDLVDTMLARSHGADVGEVVGGCFCCRFPDLLKTIQEVTDSLHPDIMLAEPVGSCTDIVATVVKPLERDYPVAYEVAPFTVLVDPNRQLTGFPASLDDLFHWQLGEADMIAISKSDLLTDAQRQAEQQRFQALHPGKPILSLSACTGAGVAEWLARVLQPATTRRNVVPVDYIIYAEAEACLGWLNATLQLQGASPFSPRQWMSDFFGHLRKQLQGLDAEIAHVKVHVYAEACVLKASLTGLDREIDWDRQEDCQVRLAAVTINARVNSDPDTLQQVIESTVQCTVQRTTLSVQVLHMECFSPSPPQPTFRLV